MEIFGCLLSLRARADYHLGFLQEDGTTHFSPYVVCEKKIMGLTPAGSAQTAVDRGGHKGQQEKVGIRDSKKRWA